MRSYTTLGLFATKEFGNALRFCTVNIDVDIPINHVKELNIDEFYSWCRMCQKSCQVRLFWKMYLYGKILLKEKLIKKCCTSMKYRVGCGVCSKVCPYKTLDMKIIWKLYLNTMEYVIDKARLMGW